MDEKAHAGPCRGGGNTDLDHGEFPSPSREKHRTRGCYCDRRSRFLSLHILRDSLAIESVDNLCLDPACNFERDCNLLFKTLKAREARPPK